MQKLHRCLTQKPSLAENIHHLDYADPGTPDANQKFQDILNLSVNLRSLTYHEQNQEVDSFAYKTWSDLFTQASFPCLTLVLTRGVGLALIPRRALRRLVIVESHCADMYSTSEGRSRGMLIARPEDTYINAKELVLERCNNSLSTISECDSKDDLDNELLLTEFLAEHMNPPEKLVLVRCGFTSKHLAKFLSECCFNTRELQVQTHASYQDFAGSDNHSSRGYPSWTSQMPMLSVLDLDSDFLRDWDKLQSVKILTIRHKNRMPLYKFLSNLLRRLEGNFAPGLSSLILIGPIYEIYKPRQDCDPMYGGCLEKCVALVDALVSICARRGLSVNPRAYLEDCAKILSAHKLIEASKGRVAGVDKESIDEQGMIWVDDKSSGWK